MTSGRVGRLVRAGTSLTRLLLNSYIQSRMFGRFYSLALRRPLRLRLAIRSVAQCDSAVHPRAASGKATLSEFDMGSHLSKSPPEHLLRAISGRIGGNVIRTQRVSRRPGLAEQANGLLHRPGRRQKVADDLPSAGFREDFAG